MNTKFKMNTNYSYPRLIAAKKYKQLSPTLL